MDIVYNKGREDLEASSPEVVEFHENNSTLININTSQKFAENASAKENKVWSIAKKICFHLRSLRNYKLNNHKIRIGFTVVIVLLLATSAFFGYCTNFVDVKKCETCANVYLGCRDTYLNINELCGYDLKCITSNVYRCPASCLMQSSRGIHIEGGLTGIFGDGPIVFGNNDEGYSLNSWICPSAIHSEHSGNIIGGCFRVTEPIKMKVISGTYSNGIQSVGRENVDGNVNSFYAFKFSESIKSEMCIDYLVPGSVVNTLIMSLMALLINDQKFSYICSYAISFWTVILYRGTHELLWIISSFTRFITCLVYSHFVYVNFGKKLFVKNANNVLSHAVYATALSITLHFDTIFYKFQRIRLSDGQYDRMTLFIWITLGTIILIILIKELIPVYKEKKLITHLLPYALCSIIVFVVPGVFNLKFRIHHWMIGLVALTIIRSTDAISVPLVGIASGLFIEGIARWGLDPMVEV